jgi:2-polyprenyl-6-methoxyphenol hydroxylase-like FAD-dependent oxidoreductase
MDQPLKCIVIGAGPVGALAALYAARRGWDVEVYELRGGMYDRLAMGLDPRVDLILTTVLCRSPG